MRSLDGEVALVTGGGRGIGRIIAEALAAEGAAVAVLARRTAEIESVATGIEDRGGTALALACDVTDQTRVAEAVGTVDRRLGGPTLAINNAGTCRAIGPLVEVDPGTWWREVETHVRGAALVSHYALRSMIPRRRGRIVNIYGNLGDTAGRYSSAYAVAKASLLRLTEQMALECRDAGITVLALHPGLVHTAMTDELATGDARRWLPAFATIPAERFQPPDRLGDAIVAIAAGAADPLTGRLLFASEDIPALATQADRLTAHDERVLRTTGV
jgi:NAD(P)-dependent dehydrogenase (short-subunit alcohol dehydrogenase family)